MVFSSVLLDIASKLARVCSGLLSIEGFLGEEEGGLVWTGGVWFCLHVIELLLHSIIPIFIISYLTFLSEWQSCCPCLLHSQHYHSTISPTATLISYQASPPPSPAFSPTPPSAPRTCSPIFHRIPLSQIIPPLPLSRSPPAQLSPSATMAITLSLP